jgi:hypothetical protein
VCSKSLKIADSYALLSTVKLSEKKVDPLHDAERKNDTTRHKKNKLKRADEKYDGLLILCDL